MLVLPAYLFTIATVSATSAVNTPQMVLPFDSELQASIALHVLHHKKRIFVTRQ